MAIAALSVLTPSVPEEVSVKEKLLKKAKEIETYLGEGKREAAINVLHEALALPIQLPEFHYNLAVVSLTFLQ